MPPSQGISKVSCNSIHHKGTTVEKITGRALELTKSAEDQRYQAAPLYCTVGVPPCRMLNADRGKVYRLRGHHKRYFFGSEYSFTEGSQAKAEITNQMRHTCTHTVNALYMHVQLQVWQRTLSVSTFVQQMQELLTTQIVHVPV